MGEVTRGVVLECSLSSSPANPKAVVQRRYPVPRDILVFEACRNSVAKSFDLQAAAVSTLIRAVEILGTGMAKCDPPRERQAQLYLTASEPMIYGHAPQKRPKPRSDFGRLADALSAKEGMRYSDERKNPHLRDHRQRSAPTAHAVQAQTRQLGENERRHPNRAGAVGGFARGTGTLSADAMERLCKEYFMYVTYDAEQDRLVDVSQPAKPWGKVPVPRTLRSCQGSALVPIDPIDRWRGRSRCRRCVRSRSAIRSSGQASPPEAADLFEVAASGPGGETHQRRARRYGPSLVR